MEITELKLRLMQQGAVFTKNAKGFMNRSRFGRIFFPDYATTGGIVVVLDERVYVNVPVKIQGTPFTIDYENGAFCLLYNKEMLYLL